MSFTLPEYKIPDFKRPEFLDAPLVTFKKVEKEGVAPENYHATSVYPEYFHVEKGDWRLLDDSRLSLIHISEPTRPY